MKAKQMLEMAYICGLQTIEEAYYNITRHSMSLFSYSAIASEERELMVDMAIKGMLDEDKEDMQTIDKEMKEYLSKEDMQTIDKEMEEYFQQND